MNNIFTIVVTASLILAACSSGTQTASASLPTTPSPRPTASEIKVLPTASSPGNSIVWENLQVTMDGLEVTQDYLTDFGSTRSPTEDSNFLWVHILLKNTGQTGIDVPISEHYSILYAAAELKPTYGHRADYVDYTTLGPLIFPNQELDGWLRFDVPKTAELSELRFVFIPESAQIGTSYTSPNYPYADDKPTYVWNCIQ
jgi:hypothetical protein